MPRFNYIWILTLKDLKRFVMDRGAIGFFILFPIFFMTLFSFMGEGSSDSRLYYYLLTREEPGGLSHQIIDGMVTENESALAPGAPVIVKLDDYEESLQKVEDEKLAGFLAFPENFTEDLYAGRGTEIEVVSNPENVNMRAALSGLASSISSQIGAHYVIAGSTVELMITGGILSPADTEEIQQAIAGMVNSGGSSGNNLSGISVTVEKIGEIEAESGINWALTGYLVMFVFFGAAMGTEAIVAERQNHTLERLLAGSVKRNEILGGMFLGIALKGIIQVILFWLFGILVFKADLGLAPGAVFLLSFIFVITSSAFAIMLATLVKTQRSAGSVGTLASLILAPLGGCWWPLFILPKWMQGMAKVSPHGWANTGFNKLMLFGAEFNDVIPEMVILIGFAVVFGAIAVWKFRATVD